MHTDRDPDDDSIRIQIRMMTVYGSRYGWWQHTNPDPDGDSIRIQIRILTASGSRLGWWQDPDPDPYDDKILTQIRMVPGSGSRSGYRQDDPDKLWGQFSWESVALLGGVDTLSLIRAHPLLVYKKCGVTDQVSEIDRIILMPHRHMFACKYTRRGCVKREILRFSGGTLYIPLWRKWHI